MFSRALVIAALLSGCATADRETGQQVSLVDAAINNDPIDARNITPPVDAHVNPPGVDAPSGGCTPAMDDLLANGAMDSSPAGTGWTAMPINQGGQSFPIISSDMPMGYSVDTSPNAAWMGGVPGGGATDSMYQDFTVPASTTSLVLTGSYMVLTSETGTTAKDKASVELRTTGGTKIESVISLSNTSTASSWTPLNHAFTNLSAGQTVRLYFTSTATAGTTMNVTDFFYDSLQLVATHCD